MVPASAECRLEMPCFIDEKHDVDDATFLDRFSEKEGSYCGRVSQK